ncbi:MAG: ThuA domain-containing protein [Ilumatobacteraceae bacterium]
MSTVLVLAGGSPHAHDFAATGRELVWIGEALGHTVEFAEHPEIAADRLADPGDRAPVDALVVDGLWWRMLGDAYDPWRSEHGYSPSADARRALSGFVESGGGMVALHTATICFDDWPAWGDVVGGSWVWGHSSHPPYGPVTVEVVADHPVVADVGPTIELDDEIYGDLEIRPGVEVLVSGRRHPADDPQAVVWIHRFGAGRVVYDGLGHDVASLRHPRHRRLVGQAISWVVPESQVVLESQVVTER